MTSTTLQNANDLAVQGGQDGARHPDRSKSRYASDDSGELYTKDNVDECIDLHKSIGDIK